MNIVPNVHKKERKEKETHKVVAGMSKTNGHAWNHCGAGGGGNGEKLES